MARKTPATTTDKTDITLLKTGTCKNLLGTADVQYEIADTTDGIQIRLSDYSGNGHYSKAWITLDSILESLEAFASRYPLVSLALKDAYPASTSTNSWGFMMAVLLAEGLVERLGVDEILAVVDEPARIGDVSRDVDDHLRVRIPAGADGLDALELLRRERRGSEHQRSECEHSSDRSLDYHGGRLTSPGVRFERCAQNPTSRMLPPPRTQGQLLRESKPCKSTGWWSPRVMSELE